jgi:hypothetical protein
MHKRALQLLIGFILVSLTACYVRVCGNWPASRLPAP